MDHVVAVDQARAPDTAALPHPLSAKPRRSLVAGLGRRGVAYEIAVGVAALFVFSWRLTRPSPQWDEAISVDVTGRRLEEILALASKIDLVHLTYYLLAHALPGVGGSLAGLRWVSVFASALSAVLLVRIGRSLGSLPVGTAAAGIFIVAPLVTRYAQEGRPYALATATATGATLALLAACRRPWRRRRWVGYATLVVLGGLLNLLTVTILAAHAVYVAGRAPRAVHKSWLAAATAAAAALSPLAIGAFLQRDQLDWLPSPEGGDLLRFFTLQYAGGGGVALLLLALAVIWARRGTHTPALVLGLAWALVPPLVLWTVSQASPLFDVRYVVFTLPGSALALASVAPRLRPLGTLAAVAVLAWGGWHMQSVYRLPASGHGEDIAGAAQRIATAAEPGDAVVYLPGSRRVVALAYPEAFTDVDDVALESSPAESATLFGIEASAKQVSRALLAHERVWVLTGPPRLGEPEGEVARDTKRILGTRFRLAHSTHYKNYDVLLYLRVERPAPTVR